MDLTIEIESNQFITVIRLCGELDDYHAPILNDAVQELLQAQLDVCLIVDLAKTAFVDSVGIGALMIVYKKVVENGGRFALVSTKPHIKRIFGSGKGRVGKTFPLFETVDAARKALL